MRKFLRKADKKIGEVARKVGKGADQVTREIDARLSKAIGLEGDAQISHALNTDSPHHKDAVKGLKGVSSCDKYLKRSGPITTDESSTTPPVAEKGILKSDILEAVAVVPTAQLPIYHPATPAAEAPTGPELPMDPPATPAAELGADASDEVYVIGNMHEVEEA